MRWNVRRASRSPSDLLGRIHGLGGEVVKCSVSNISQDGAALRTDVPLPAEFDLEIPELRKTYRVALCWKDECEAGVQFLRTCDAAHGRCVRT